MQNDSRRPSSLRPGRPKLNTNKSRVYVYMDDVELKRLKEKAEIMHLSLSTLIRLKLMEQDDLAGEE